MNVLMRLLNNTSFYRISMDILNLLTCKSSTIAFFWLIVLSPELVCAIAGIVLALLPEYRKHPIFTAF